MSDFWLITGLWSLAYFVTLIPISINGLGVQELSLTFLFSTVAGLSTPVSLTIAVLIPRFLCCRQPDRRILPAGYPVCDGRQPERSSTVRNDLFQIK